MSSHGLDIANILDEEIDVSRYYAELVPTQISPEEFWARFFFKQTVLLRGGIVDFDEDDDEELAWETSDESALGGATIDVNGSGSSSDAETVRSLKEENSRLKGQIKALVSRVADLEKIIKSNAKLAAQIACAL